MLDEIAIVDEVHRLAFIDTRRPPRNIAGDAFTAALLLAATACSSGGDAATTTVPVVPVTSTPSTVPVPPTSSMTTWICGSLTTSCQSVVINARAMGYGRGSSNAFTAILPADNPRYQLLIMLDEPQPLKETFGFITSGWNAVPTGGLVIARIAPLLGIEPRFDLPPSDRLILAASKTTQ